MLDLTDVVAELNHRHGDQLPMAKANSDNPTTNICHGLCPGDAQSPWEELFSGGSRIKAVRPARAG